MKDVFPLLSIIIPMYNVENYIEKTLVSVIENDWLENDFEIVIIDDESPDNSAVIAREIAEKHKNVKLISQKNKGLGGARNTGILNSNGKYIFFLDSDDYLIKNMIKIPLSIALQKDLDIIEFGANKVDEKENLIEMIQFKRCPEVIDGQNYIINFDFINSVCNKLFRKDFIVNNKILFIEKVYAEDFPFSIEVLLKATRVYSIETRVVNFLQNSQSITRSKRNTTIYNKFINDYKLVISRVIDLNKKYSKNTETFSKLNQKIAFLEAGLILMVIRSIKTVNQKRNEINDLKGRGLYPIKNKTGSLIRDGFVFFINCNFFLNIIFNSYNFILNIKNKNE
jgi:glycosyltransferase involved in cell wall biosynthesis